MKSLAKNSIYNIIYQMLSLIFPLLSSMYVARIILEDGVGKVAYAQNIASYFTSIALLGFPAYGIREIARVKESKTECNQTFFELLFINAISTTAASVLYIVLLICIDSFRNELLLYLCAGAVVWLNYANIDWFYQGKEEYGYITARSLAIKVLSLVALVLLVKQKDDYVLYALISSCGTACNYILNLFHARKYITFDVNIKKLGLKKHLKPLFVLAIAAFLGNVYNKVDVTMLGMMVSDAVVGYYSNAHKIILIVVSCCIAVTTVFMPRLSYYYENDRCALNKLVDFGTKLLIAIVVPATVGLSLLASDAIVLLYGKAFAPAGETLAIFAPMLLIRPIGDLLCYQLLISAGKEQKRIYTSFIATVVNIVLNYLLIPKWQQNGAAVASVISEVIVNGLLLTEVLKIVPIKIDKIFMLKTLAATCAMAVGIIGIKQIVHAELSIVLLEVAVGVGLYVITSFILKNEVVLNLTAKIKSMILHH
ncbi:oligosaccharide flippase family protein [Gemmiger formicilis]